jgi:hypothetical protein
MKKGVFLLVILLFASSTANAEQSIKPEWKRGFHFVNSDQPYRLKRFKASDLSYAPVRERSHCVDVGNGLRVCKYLSDTEIFFAFEKNGRRLGQWATTGLLGGGSRFEVLRGDLDRDGNDELILANLDSCCNSMGISRWTLSIFPNPEKGFKPPLQFSVEEYGAKGTFVKHPGDKRSQILVTDWQYIDHPKRGNGMYIIGRWFQYQAGKLIAVKSRPVIARRFLFGFAEKVDKTRGNPRIPLMWFKNLKTEVVSPDPALLGVQTNPLVGVIKDLQMPHWQNGYQDLRLSVELMSGEVKNYRYSLLEFEDEDDTFRYLGNRSFQSIYPENYSPADFRDRLLKKRVEIIRYRIDDSGRPLGSKQIIWLQDY